MRTQNGYHHQVVPAYAGVIPIYIGTRQRNSRCSRMCGGDPRSYLTTHVEALLFPHFAGGGVIPKGPLPEGSDPSYSRRCGGDPIPIKEIEKQTGLFPHARGYCASRSG